MVKIQMELNDDANEIVSIVKVMKKLKTKKQAIDYIIKVYGDQQK